MIGNENFTDAKDVLSTMSIINCETDSFIEKELLIIGDYAQSETYINQASTYLNEGDYIQMFEKIDMARELTPDYRGISKIELLITDEYNNLEYMYKDYFEDYDFENCLTALNQMLSLRKGNDSSVEDQVEIVHMCINSDNYIADAMDVAGQKNYDAALEILNYAIGENPDYGRIHTEYDIIKKMKKEYDGYIGQINHIANLNSSNNYLDTYNQANSLLNNSDFVVAVLQDDIDRLNGIKSSAYNSGKNIPGNSVSFNLIKGSSSWQSKNINNIFGSKLYSINFIQSGNFNGNTNRKSNAEFAIDNYKPSLILVSSGDLVLMNTDENYLSFLRRSNPDCIVDKINTNKIYSLDRNGIRFNIKIDSASFGGNRYWYESLVVTISVQ